MPSVPDPQVQTINVMGQFGIEPEHVILDFKPGPAPLHDIDRSGHGSQVDTLSRGAILDIGHIAGFS